MSSRALVYAWILATAFWLWLAFTLLSASDDYLAVARIEQEAHPASEQVWYFHLNFGKQGRVTLSADDSTPIAKWLAQHDRRTVRVELYEVER